MKTRRRTGQIALHGGMYLCSRDCGTMIELERGEPLPWCLHCLARVEWRYVNASGTIRTAASNGDGKAQEEVG